MDFIKFLGHSVLEAWEVGDHVFALIEGLCLLVGAGFLWFGKHHKLHGAWEKAEPWIMKGAFGMFLVVFFGSSLFYVPFKHHKESEKQIASMAKDLKDTSNELSTTKAKYEASQSARLARLENPTAAGIPIFDQLRSMLREINPGILTNIDSGQLRMGVFLTGPTYNKLTRFIRENPSASDYISIREGSHRAAIGIGGPYDRYMGLVIMALRRRNG